MTKPEQRWRPITYMPAFKFAVSSAAETAHEQAEHMRLAIHQPGLINRVELARMRLVYQDTALYADMCCEQLRRWRVECTTSEEAKLLDQLDVLTQQWVEDTNAVIDAVKTLLDEGKGKAFKPS
ncbi:hypothetical protein [Dyella caseinilytica]|uniref:Uncharacterized protein n=1 Tax=Dyella caseinilytica TaxID=1849581 RepID=A0ABX7GY15_9GAMM|nr:hypothetical protein [Dyella caseinilytica]QRN55376.1 hypothetical protein ISN74_08660 [Dyella caseinilytica]GGA01270.1 hypothetical protein GCM10011408_23130 [Dyella caseinilytica]